MTLRVNNLIGISSGSVPLDDIVTTYKGSDTDSGTASSFTVSGAALGTASANRWIVVGALTITSAGTLDGGTVTVGGTGLTQRILVDGANGQSSLWAGSVPTGTTGDIVVTPASGSPWVSVMWWSCDNVGTGVTDTDFDSAAVNTATSVSLNCSAGGAIITAVQHQSNTYNFRQAGGHGDYAAIQTGLTVTWTPGTGTAITGTGITQDVNEQQFTTSSNRDSLQTGIALR